LFRVVGSLRRESKALPLSAIDLSSLLQPVSPDAPSGANLEYDPVFADMERSAQGTEEQQYGATVIEGKEADWAEVRRTALELLGRTRDLRIGVYLARAALKTEGLAGFRDGLSLLRGYVEKYWGSVHPQLDPEDDNDPTSRVNTLAGLCDNTAVLNVIRRTPIVVSRTAGQFSRNDIAYATGELPFSGPADEKPKMSLIDAAFQDCPLEKLQIDTRAVTEAVDDVRGLEAAVTREVGAGNMRSLEALVKELDSIRKFLVERLSRRGGLPAADGTAKDGKSQENGDAAAAATNGESKSQGATVRWTGEITSRDEAIRAITDVCRYFERYEPSSPLPLLLHRAVRLSTKSFLEILRDISPDGLGQAESISGMSSEEYMRLSAPPPPPVPAAKPAAAPAKAAPTPVNDDY
jgi:type VI secretion system protein ImpA